MNDRKQMYLFNEMEYDDYESDNWEEMLMQYEDVELEANTDEMLDKWNAFINLTDPEYL